MKNGWTLYHSIKGQIKVENYIKKNQIIVIRGV